MSKDNIINSLRSSGNIETFYFNEDLDSYIHYYPRSVNKDLSLYQRTKTSEPFYTSYTNVLSSGTVFNPYRN